MEQLTREIGRAFSNGFRQVQTIKSAARHERKLGERQLAMSAVLALSSGLQEMSIKYRTAQSNYLQRNESTTDIPSHAGVVSCTKLIFCPSIRGPLFIQVLY